MPKIVDKDKRRIEILKAIFPLLAEKGLASCTMVELARSAGIGKGTMYEYFANKEAITEAMYLYWMAEIEGKFQIDLSAFATASDKLQAWCRETVRILEADKIFADVMMEFWAVVLKNRQGAGEPMRVLYDHYIGFIAEVLDEGVQGGEFYPDLDVQTTARNLLAFLDGLGMHWCLFPTIRPIFQADLYLSTLIRGIQVKES